MTPSQRPWPIASPQIREMATVAGNLCQQKRCWFYRSGFLCYKRGGATCPCYAVTGTTASTTPRSAPTAARR